MGNKIDDICFCINSNNINTTGNEQVMNTHILIQKFFYIENIYK